MQNNLAELERHVSELKKARELLMELWSGVMPFCPSEQQFNLWLEGPYAKNYADRHC